MPISSVVITSAEGQGEAVAGRIAALHGTEVHGVLPDGQVVAVIEADSVQDEVDIVVAMNAVEGVVAVRMAYHNFEDSAGS